MRLSSAVALLAATAPIAVSAKGKLGFAIGARNEDLSCKTKQDFDKDFKALKGTGTKYVRTYAVLDNGADQQQGPVCYVPGAILPAAKEAGVQVVLGLWADKEDLYQEEKAEILKHVQEYKETIYAFTVGSEGLYRHYEQEESLGYTAEDILSRINDFKDAITNPKYDLKQKVGTVDTWNKFDDGQANPIIEGGVDLFLINAFAYWESQDISNATNTYLENLSRAYAKIQSVAGSTSLELWSGETGWPTDGADTYHDDVFAPEGQSTAGYAVASTANAQTYFKEAVCAAIDWNFDVFYFSAFAEPWKPESTGRDGKKYDETHWGAFDAQRNPVIKDLTCSYP